jgi:hypothetical protein
MFRWQRVHLVFAVYGLLISISAFVTVYALFSIPSDPRNNIFLGLSLQRLGMVGGMSLAGVISFIFAVKAFRDEPWAGKAWIFLFGQGISAKAIRWAAGLVLTLGLIVSLMPPYRFGEFLDYFIRIAPIVTWLTFAGFLTFILAWIEMYGVHWQHFLSTLRRQKIILTAALISITIFVLIWVLIAKTGMGLLVGDGYWYEAGVPILSLQVIFAFAIGMGVLFLERTLSKDHLPAWSDLLIFFLIWGIAAFLWAREPLRPSFFAPGPYAPDNAFHPYSDAASFDLGSQFALIGQGINNGVFFDRALYMAFLVFLHSLAGQDYVQVVTLQAAIYAIFPAILYLLGKTVHSRSFGMILAVLTTLRGVNGIAAGSMINLANQKQLLTDFPTAIFVAWFALMIVKWLNDPAKNYLYALWAGGVAGLAVMLRTNALFLVLFAAPVVGIVYWRQKLRGVLVGFLLVIAMFASTFAWGIYNDKSVFDVYLYRIRLVIEARYSQPATPAPQGNESQPSRVARAGVLHLASSVEPKTVNPTQWTAAPQSPVSIAREDDEINIPVFVATHFLHNIITSILILPTTPDFHNLRYTLKSDDSLWQYWDGDLSHGTGFFLILNLMLIALGLGVGWKFARLSGLAPLGIFLFYDLSNAFARTSGGRYVVPIDWIVLFYFALGLFQVILWGMTLSGFKDDHGAINQPTPDSVNNMTWTWMPLKKAPWVILFFLFIGSFLPVSAQIFPRRYEAQSRRELISLLDGEGYLQEMGLNKADLSALSRQSSSFKIINGRALYPRLFWENEGIPKKRNPYSVMEFPRIAFMVIGPSGISSVILPRDEAPYFPNASDVIVLGCQKSNYIDALAVVVIKGQTVVYVRQPSSPLQCPLQQPVCDENHTCW